MSSLSKSVGLVGICLLFPSFLVGPTITYSQYQVIVRNNERQKTGQKSIITFVTALIFIIPVYLQQVYPVSYLMTSEFTELHWWAKAKFVYLSMLFIRFRYYAAWTLSKSFFIAFGAGEYGNNVNICNVEFAQNVHEVTNNWNLCTNEWLKTHIYKALSDHGMSKTMATYSTNVVSALWHGFYPGYIMTFVTGGILTGLGRQVRKTIRPYFLSNAVLKLFYDCICAVVMITLMTYSIVPFQVYTLTNSMKIWYNLMFIGHAIIIAGFISVYLIRRFKPGEKGEDAKAVKVVKTDQKKGTMTLQPEKPKDQ